MPRIIDARPEHARQIVHFLGITCYWKEFVEGNGLGLPYEEFMLDWVVLPRLTDTRVLVADDDQTRVLGCVTAATLERLGEMPDYTPHLHPQVMATFGAWFQFPVSNSVVLELFALLPEWRGQGYGAQLYQHAQQLAVRHGKDTIAAFVWSCFPDSLITLTRRGFAVEQCITFPKPVTVPLLYMERSAHTLAHRDLFQTSGYQQARNLLLAA